MILEWFWWQCLLDTITCSSSIRIAIDTIPPATPIWQMAVETITCTSSMANGNGYHLLLHPALRWFQLLPELSAFPVRGKNHDSSKYYMLEHITLHYTEVLGSSRPGLQLEVLWAYWLQVVCLHCSGVWPPSIWQASAYKWWTSNAHGNNQQTDKAILGVGFAWTNIL